MPFCSNCGFKVKENDKFCFQCGKDLRAANNDGNVPIQPVSKTESVKIDPNAKAYLSVCCLASSPHANVIILPNDKTKSVTKIGAGLTEKIEYEPGDYVITYTVDRGPGFTFVASRVTRYQKRLSFHPGETIVMDANVGRQMTQVNFSSSMGFQIN